MCSRGHTWSGAMYAPMEELTRWLWVAFWLSPVFMAAILFVTRNDGDRS